MSKKIYQLIKVLDDVGAIKDFYLHRNYESGELELNIEFNNDIANNILEKENIKSIDACAYWE